MAVCVPTLDQNMPPPPLLRLWGLKIDGFIINWLDPTPLPFPKIDACVCLPAHVRNIEEPEENRSIYHTDMSHRVITAQQYWTSTKTIQ